ncbi:MAG: undecaprenyldiphospho-muramoylpentapeptide beta-N-acetylglucosaminyltransferase [Marinicellaceae bacterium]
MNPKNVKIAIMAGGTGGHIFPGLAVAEQLRNNNAQVVWLGAIGGMEESLVKQHDIPIKLLAIKGLRGKGIKGLLTMPFKLFGATRQASKFFKSENVNAVISMGGYVAGPGGLAAKLKRIPLLVHEQNSKFGMTNKYLSKWAKKVLTGFNLHGLYKSKWVGNPVRSDIENCQKSRKDNTVVNILVIGGSLGAKSLNTIVPKLLKPLLEDDLINVKHQCGKNNQESTRTLYETKSNVSVYDFINDMSAVYSWADFIIARAGALTIAEINAVGLPAIFVPYPYAVDDHQTSNAQNIVDSKAGFIWQEKQPITILAGHIDELVKSKDTRNSMAINSKQLHKKDSAKTVAKLCLEMLR